MSEELAAIIRQEIQEKGPIPFSRWMELCLYHPQYGYYMKPGRKTGAGRDADFVTPPTLHPFFGKAVAREIVELWTRAGKPTTWRVLEWGGGEGDVARGVLAYLDSHHTDLARSLQWHHAEISPNHQAAQHSADVRISQDQVDMSWEPTTPSCREHEVTLAIEFLDALPFDLYEFDVRKGSWMEVHVALEAEKIVEMILPPRIRTGWRPWGSWAWKTVEPSGPNFVDGQRAVRANQAVNWAKMAGNQASHAVLVVDYGDVGERLVTPERMDGTVRGFRKHAFANPLDDPGDVDITASIPFDALAWQMKDAFGLNDTQGNPVHEMTLETLEQFLLRHGILDELNSIDRSTVEGASSYLRLRQLLLPTGMGAAFKVARFERKIQK